MINRLVKQREYFKKNILWGQIIYTDKQYSHVLIGQFKKWYNNSEAPSVSWILNRMWYADGAGWVFPYGTSSHPGLLSVAVGDGGLNYPRIKQQGHLRHQAQVHSLQPTLSYNIFFCDPWTETDLFLLGRGVVESVKDTYWHVWFLTRLFFSFSFKQIAYAFLFAENVFEFPKF